MTDMGSFSFEDYPKNAHRCLEVDGDGMNHYRRTKLEKG